jgi:hypothetical protein
MGHRFSLAVFFKNLIRIMIFEPRMKWKAFHPGYKKFCVISGLNRRIFRFIYFSSTHDLAGKAPILCDSEAILKQEISRHSTR